MATEPDFSSMTDDEIYAYYGVDNPNKAQTAQTTQSPNADMAGAISAALPSENDLRGETAQTQTTAQSQAPYPAPLTQEEWDAVNAGVVDESTSPVAEGFKTFFGSLFTGQGRKDAMDNYREQTRGGGAAAKTAGYLSDLGNAFYQGLLGGASHLTEAAGNLTGWEDLVDASRQYREDLAEYAPTNMTDTGAVDENGVARRQSWGDKVAETGKDVMRIMGEFAPAAASGGSTAVARTAGTAAQWGLVGAGGVNTGFDIYRTTVENAEQNGFSKAQAAGLGIAGGAIDAFANAFLMGKFLGKGAKPIEEKFFQTFIKRQLGGALKTGSVMGASGGAQNVIQQLAENGEVNLEATGDAIKDAVIQGAMFSMMNGALHSPIEWSQYRTASAVKGYARNRDAAAADEMATEKMVGDELEAHTAESVAIESARKVLGDEQGAAMFCERYGDAAKEFIAARMRGVDVPVEAAKDIGDLAKAFQTQEDMNAFGDRLMQYMNDAYNAKVEQRARWDENLKNAAEEETEAKRKRENGVDEAGVNAVFGIEDQNARPSDMTRDSRIPRRINQPRGNRAEEGDPQVVMRAEDAKSADQAADEARAFGEDVSRPNEDYAKYFEWLGGREDTDAMRYAFNREQEQDNARRLIHEMTRKDEAKEEPAKEEVEPKPEEESKPAPSPEAPEAKTETSAPEAPVPEAPTAVAEPAKKSPLRRMVDAINAKDVETGRAVENELREEIRAGKVPTEAEIEAATEGMGEAGKNAIRKYIGQMEDAVKAKADDAKTSETDAATAKTDAEVREDAYNAWLKRQVGKNGKPKKDSRAMRAQFDKMATDGKVDAKTGEDIKAKSYVDAIKSAKTGEELEAAFKAMEADKESHVGGSREKESWEATEEYERRAALFSFAQFLEGKNGLGPENFSIGDAKDIIDIINANDHVPESISKHKDALARAEALLEGMKPKSKPTAKPPSAPSVSDKAWRNWLGTGRDGSPIELSPAEEKASKKLFADLVKAGKVDGDTGEVIAAKEAEPAKEKPAEVKPVAEKESAPKAKEEETAVEAQKPEQKSPSRAAVSRRYVDSIQFEHPIVGKDGSKLIAYEWKNMLSDGVDSRGNDYTKKVSDWMESVVNEDTNRGIVHQFVVVDANGNEHVVSSGTAAKMLGIEDSAIRGEALKAIRKVVAAGKITEQQKQRIESVLQRRKNKDHFTFTDRNGNAYVVVTFGPHQLSKNGLPVEYFKINPEGKITKSMVGYPQSILKKGWTEIPEYIDPTKSKANPEAKPVSSSESPSAPSADMKALGEAAKAAQKELGSLAMKSDAELMKHRAMLENAKRADKVKAIDDLLAYRAAAKEAKPKEGGKYAGSVDEDARRLDSRTVGEASSEDPALLDRLGQRMAKLVPGVKVRVGELSEGAKRSGATAEFDPATGEVVVSPDAPMSDVVHEIGGHGTLEWAKRNAPALYSKCLEYVRTAPKDVKDFVYENYRDFADRLDKVVHEIFAQRFAREHGAEFQKLLEEPKSRKWWTNVVNAVRSVFQDAAKRNGVDTSRLRGMDADGFMRGVAEQMAMGRELNRWTAFGRDAKYLEDAGVKVAPIGGMDDEGDGTLDSRTVNPMTKDEMDKIADRFGGESKRFTRGWMLRDGRNVELIPNEDGDWQDHDMIREVMDKSRGVGASTGVKDVAGRELGLKTGGIRYHMLGDEGIIDIHSAPTPEQMDTLRRFAEFDHGGWSGTKTLKLDFGDGTVIDYDSMDSVKKRLVSDVQRHFSGAEETDDSRAVRMFHGDGDGSLYSRTAKQYDERTEDGRRFNEKYADADVSRTGRGGFGRVGDALERLDAGQGEVSRPSGEAVLRAAREDGYHLGAVEDGERLHARKPFRDGETEKHGMETLHVYRDGDTVYKYRRPEVTPGTELEKVRRHNELFGDRTGYEVVGVAETEDGRPSIVLKQPYVDFVPKSGNIARKQLEADLRRRFGRIEVSEDGTEMRAGGWIVDDLKDANVALDAKTGRYAVIDALVHRAEDFGGKAPKMETADGGERGGATVIGPGVGDGAGGERLYSRRVTQDEDKAYMDAVKRGDMETAQRMLMEAARKVGYSDDVSYRASHHAPVKDGYNSSLDDVKGMFGTDDRSELLSMGYGRPTARQAVDSIVRAKGNPDAMIDVYRAVAKSVKDVNLRRGDWVSLSEDYARQHGESWLDGKYRIIHQKVRAGDLYTDGNMIEEAGFDDGIGRVYADTRNGTKLMLPTYDEAGNVIPLSKRFDPKNESVLYSRQAHPIDHARLQANGVDDAAHHYMDKEVSKGDRSILEFVKSKNFREGLSEMYFKNMADRFRPVRNVIVDSKMAENMTRQEAEAWADNDKASPYHQLRVLSGKTETNMKRMEAIFNDLKDDLKGFRDLGIDVDDLSVFSYAKHAPARNAQKLKDSGVADGSGISDALANDIVSGRQFTLDGGATMKQYTPEQLKALQGAHDRLVKRMNAEFGLKFMHDHGLIDRDSMNRMLGAYGIEHVNLRDEIEGGAPVSPSMPTIGKPVKNAKGRSSALEDNAIVHSVSDTFNTIANAIKNDAAESLAQYVEQHPEMGEVRVKTPTDKVDEAMVEFRRNNPVKDASGKVVGEKNQQMVVVLYGKRGVDLSHAFREQDVVHALPFIQKVSRAWASFATQLSPTFSARNFMKDTVEVALDTIATDGPMAAAKFLKNQATLMPLWNREFRRVFNEYSKTGRVVVGDGASDIARYFKEYVESGALIGGGGAREGYGKTERSLKEVSKELAGIEKGVGKVAKAWEWYKEKVGKVNESIEMLTRFSNYYNRRANLGESVEKAAINSREASTDFGMYGDQRYLNSIFTFSNSILGGTMRATKSMMKNKYGRMLAVGMVAMGMLEEFINLRSDDESVDANGGKSNTNVSEYERENGFRIRVGDKYVRIPTHLGPWSVLKYLGGNMARAAMGQISWDKAAGNVRDSATTMLSHFSGTGEHGFGKDSPSLINSFTPSVLQPFVQIASNEDYKGEKIHREHDLGDAKYAPDFKYAKKGTGAVWVGLSRALNNIPFFSGGSDLVKGRMSVPPEDIEYLAKQIVKNFGTDVVNTALLPATAYNVATGEEELSDNLRNIPLVKDFLKDMPDITKRYYEAKDRHAEEGQAFKNSEPNGKAAYLREHPTAAMNLGKLESSIKNLSAMLRGEIVDKNGKVIGTYEPTEAKKQSIRKVLRKQMANYVRIVERKRR